MSAADTTISGRPSDLSEENYRFLQEHLYRHSGLLLEKGKAYLIEARLLPLVAKRQLSGLNELCARLRTRNTDTLNRDVIEAMSTNETLFFRDPAVWEALRTIVLPSLIRNRQSSNRLRVWSAAASSGQEAYSLAMTLMEMPLDSWDVQILGTDISSRMIERARAASYSQFEVNRGLPASHLIRYFERTGRDWQIKDTVKRWVRLEEHDLRQQMQRFGPFDLVMCRNVLIYFDVPTKQAILRQLRNSMSGGGYLVLGSAETTLNLDAQFERQEVGRATFYRVKQERKLG